jgi:hypothetical protein
MTSSPVPTHEGFPVRTQHVATLLEARNVAQVLPPLLPPCRCFIVMPDDAAIEKAQTLQALGAEVVRVRPVSITHPDHPVNMARRRAQQEPGSVFADQFENEANRWAGGAGQACVSCHVIQMGPQHSELTCRCIAQLCHLSVCLLL